MHPIIITIIEQIIKSMGFHRVSALITSAFVLIITVGIVSFMKNYVLVKIRGNIND